MIYFGRKGKEAHMKLFCEALGLEEAWQRGTSPSKENYKVYHPQKEQASYQGNPSCPPQSYPPPGIRG